MSDEAKIKKALGLTKDLWNLVVSIEVIHSADPLETMRDIHNIQNRLYAIANKQNLIIKDE